MMVSVSARHLSALIPLLAKEIRDINSEVNSQLARTDSVSEEDLEERLELQELAGQYDLMLDELQTIYEGALDGGLNLPKFEDLVGPFKT